MKSELPHIPQAEISKLIDTIAPLNNRFRDRDVLGITGTEVLGIMWSVGELLRQFMEKHQAAPHPLYWRIYGRADGLKNSYLTRDFLSYCYRIRQYFPSTNSINDQFPNLPSYGLFREAFPLLENEKFRLNRDEEKWIVSSLNSTADPVKLRKLIKEFKARRIGKKNDRKQRLHEVKDIASRLHQFQREITDISDPAGLAISAEIANTFGDLIAALTQENLFVPQVSEQWPSTGIELWDNVGRDLKFLFNGNIELRNRLRRLFPPRLASRLSDRLAELSKSKSRGEAGKAL